MSATKFGAPANNIVATVGSGGYTAGSTVLNLTTGQGSLFPSLTSNQFYRLTVVQQAVAYSATANISNLTIYKATGLTGDQFTGILAIEGTTDRNYVSGDTVDVRVTAGSLSDVQSAINTLETTYGNQGISYGNSVLPSGSSPYNLSGSSGAYQSINPSNFNVTLPNSGTYFIFLTVRFFLYTGGSSSDTNAYISTQLYNSTASSYVPNSITMVFYESAESGFQGTMTFSYVVTVGSSSTIQVNASRTWSGTSPNVIAQILSDNSGVTSLAYLRLA